ncbi:hypothetical protein KUV51_12615 [Tateyamaria omphalii]|uniref:hypothetical protein n=1 Tax=Tateyamaria omphalii TaxID=299262 RepID=UPI001C999D51|nr:hypothetical protein [Tateyamaria omphalii]MBY5933845.1 hypothetical protein [Tateyamaria omphalii]
MKRTARISALAVALGSGMAHAHPAIEAFNAWCFKAGQTQERARSNMEGTAGAPLLFALTFWDTSLEPTPQAPAHAERRCEVAFSGDHADAAVTAVQAKMAMPPVFGTPIPLPAPYAAEPGTAFIEGRKLLRGRVAVVHIGIRGAQTFIGVDRLPAGMGVSE